VKSRLVAEKFNLTGVDVDASSGIVSRSSRPEVNGE